MNKIFNICLVIFFTVSVQAQDIHFSQFSSAPLLLNPALTGHHPCKLRCGLNYRNQWGSIGTPFITQSGFIDTKLKAGFLGNDWFGIGGLAFNDRAGDGYLFKTKYMASASYNKGLSSDNSFFVSLGASLGYVNRSVRFGNFYFDNQWNGFEFDQNMASYENFAGNSYSYLDLNGGILLTYEGTRGTVFLGSSLNHINRPVDSFYGTDNRLGMKLIVHGGTEIQLSDRLGIRPEGMFTTQELAKEIVFGLNVYMAFNDAKLYFGLWHRLAGDFIPVAGLEYKKFLFLFSKDLNVSPLYPASHIKGGIELSLVKTFFCSDRIAPGGKGKKGRGGRRNKNELCPAYR